MIHFSSFYFSSWRAAAKLTDIVISGHLSFLLSTHLGGTLFLISTLWGSGDTEGRKNPSLARGEKK
jgi:hypothetical protein